MHLLTARLLARRASSAVLLGSLLLEPAVADDTGPGTAIPPPPRSTIVFPPAPPARQCRVSVIGAVMYPATFESGTASLLSSLIAAAGGLTEDASGAVRVIRNSGDQQYLDYYQGLSELRVADGSVIVVEPRSDVARRAIGRDGAFVDVACLNLLDRPLVQWLPPAEATLPRLLERMGQPPTMAASIRILAPGRSEAAGTDQLTPGMVLVFDRGAVNEAALHAAAAQSPWRDLVPLDADDPPPQQAAPQNSTGFQFLPNSPAAAVTVSHDGPPEPPPVSDRSPDAHAVAASVRQTAPAESPASSSAPQPPREPVAHQVSGRQRPAPGALRRPRADTSHPPADTPRSRWPSITSALAAFAVLVIAGFWALRARRAGSHEVAEPAPNGLSASAASPPRRQPLDELINNELPLVEEEATFPTGLKLHGRTVGFRYLIHGGGAEPRGPHFTPAGSRQRPTTAGVTSAPQPQPTTPPPPGPERASGFLDEEADPRAGNGAAAASNSGGPAPRANLLSPMERALLARRKGRPA